MTNEASAPVATETKSYTVTGIAKSLTFNKGSKTGHLVFRGKGGKDRHVAFSAGKDVFIVKGVLAKVTGVFKHLEDKVVDGKTFTNRQVLEVSAYEKVESKKSEKKAA